MSTKQVMTHDAALAVIERVRELAKDIIEQSHCGYLGKDILDIVGVLMGDRHEYGDSFTGMLCGTTVGLPDGSGDECGLPYGDPVHIPRPGPKDPAREGKAGT